MYYTFQYDYFILDTKSTYLIIISWPKWKGGNNANLGNNKKKYMV